MYIKLVVVVAVAGNASYSLSPIVYFTNLWSRNEVIGISIYSSAMSLAVSVAVQKYGGDSTHPISSEVGITICIGSSSGCGRTYAKLYSSPSVQSRC
jgi:hypothetical protein